MKTSVSGLVATLVLGSASVAFSQGIPDAMPPNDPRCLAVTDKLFDAPRTAKSWVDLIAGVPAGEYEEIATCYRSIPVYPRQGRHAVGDRFYSAGDLLQNGAVVGSVLARCVTTAQVGEDFIADCRNLVTVNGKSGTFVDKNFNQTQFEATVPEVLTDSIINIPRLAVVLQTLTVQQPDVNKWDRFTLTIDKVWSWINWW